MSAQPAGDRAPTALIISVVDLPDTIGYRRSGEFVELNARMSWNQQVQCVAKAMAGCGLKCSPTALVPEARPALRLIPGGVQ